MKNRITRISPERKQELKELIEQIRQESYDQGYEDGKAFVSVETVEENTITHEGKLLRKVNREAREGDYVRPSNQKYARLIDGEIYGPVFKGSGQLLIDGYSVYAKGHNRTTSTVEVFELVEAIPQIVKSANQQRAELIEKAKEFVEKWTTTNRNSDEFSNDEFPHGLWVTGYAPTIEVEFHVNKYKHAVVALIKNCKDSELRAKGIAKCMPGDVFNEWIGKAIALARALKINIPVEFLEAVQPTEKVVGMVVMDDEHIGGKHTLIASGESLKKGYAHIGSPVGQDGIIIDDTNAQYEI